MKVRKSAYSTFMCRSSLILIVIENGHEFHVLTLQASIRGKTHKLVSLLGLEPIQTGYWALYGYIGFLLFSVLIAFSVLATEIPPFQNIDAKIA